MRISSDTLTSDAAYRLLTGCIVPRPIAWVSTLSTNGAVNAAPFSAFTFVSNRPPMVGVSVGRRDGQLKDTARNIFERGEFVVNIANWNLLSALHESSREYPYGESELAACGLATAPCEAVSTPRIAAAPVALECRLAQIVQFGDNRSNFIVGEVLAFHVADDLIADGKIETSSLNPIGRIGGPTYVRLGEIVRQEAIPLSPR